METVRIQSQKLDALVSEFNQLKSELFGGAMFSVVDDDPRWFRYDALYALLYLGRGDIETLAN